MVRLVMLLLVELLVVRLLVVLRLVTLFLLAGLVPGPVAAVTRMTTTIKVIIVVVSIGVT